MRHEDRRALAGGSGVTETVQFDPASLVGHYDERWQMEILAVPKWNAKEKRWEALVNFRGMLAIAEIKITIQGRQP